MPHSVLIDDEDYERAVKIWGEGRKWARGLSRVVTRVLDEIERSPAIAEFVAIKATAEAVGYTFTDTVRLKGGASAHSRHGWRVHVIQANDNFNVAWICAVYAEEDNYASAVKRARMVLGPEWHVIAGKTSLTCRDQYVHAGAYDEGILQ